MNKFGRRIGTTLAAGALVSEVAAGCSDGSGKAFQIDYLKPSVACGDMQIKLDGTDAAARTKAIAKGVLACYNMLPKGVFTSTGEANSIHVSFPVAGGVVDFNVLSEAPVEGDPAQYIEQARDVSVLTYQVATAKDKTQLDGAGINTYGGGPFYMWETARGEGGHYQEVKSGIQDDTGVPYLSARIGDDYKASFDSKEMACAEEIITHHVADTFNLVTSQRDIATLPSLVAPNYRNGCGQEI